MTVFELSRAESLGNQRVQPEHDAAANQGGCGEERGAETHGADGDSALRQTPHHDRIYESHGEPADFGQRQRRGHTQHGPEFLADIRCTEHDLDCSDCIVVAA